MFSVKDPVPRGLRAGVVYKFSSVICSACYIGETTRHFSTRGAYHVSTLSVIGPRTFLNIY